MAHEVLNLTSVNKPTGYSHAVRVGNTLYISGQVSVDRDGNVVGKGDIAAQARQAFQNLKNIMEEAGGSLEKIFKLTTLITHPSYLQDFRNARDEFMREPYPANTLHVVQGLALPDWLIEIEAIADLN